MKEFWDKLKESPKFVVIAVAQVLSVGMICMAVSCVAMCWSDAEYKKARYQNMYKSDEAFWGRNRPEAKDK